MRPVGGTGDSAPSTRHRRQASTNRARQRQALPEGTILTTGSVSVERRRLADGVRAPSPGGAGPAAGRRPIGRLKHVYSCAPAPRAEALAATLAPVHAAELDEYAQELQPFAQGGSATLQQGADGDGVKGNRSEGHYSCRTHECVGQPWRHRPSAKRWSTPSLQEADVAPMASSCFL